MTTTHLSLPELTASQSQKHVTHNEALEHLDVVVQLAVLDKDLSTPPGSPSLGDRYIVGASATGDWASKENEIAYYDGDGWIFKTPKNGWRCWVEDEDRFYVYFNSAWAPQTVVVTENVEYLVPSDFSSVQEALEALQAKELSGNAITTIKMESGYRISPVNITGGNFYNVRIDAEDAVTYLQAGFDNGKNVFTFTDCQVPKLVCLIDAQNNARNGIEAKQSIGTITGVGGGIINVNEDTNQTTVNSGTQYVITSVASLDWSSIGGPVSATLGDTFTATSSSADISALGIVKDGDSQNGAEPNGCGILAYKSLLFCDDYLYEGVPVAEGQTITAGSFVRGRHYRIVTAGTTDFTALGAANNNVGTEFRCIEGTSNGPKLDCGSGTGTALEIFKGAVFSGCAERGLCATNGSTINANYPELLNIGSNTLVDSGPLWASRGSVIHSNHSSLTGSYGHIRCGRSIISCRDVFADFMAGRVARGFELGIITGSRADCSYSGSADVPLFESGALSSQPQGGIDLNFERATLTGVKGTIAACYASLSRICIDQASGTDIHGALGSIDAGLLSFAQVNLTFNASAGLANCIVSSNSAEAEGVGAIINANGGIDHFGRVTQSGSIASRSSTLNGFNDTVMDFGEGEGSFYFYDMTIDGTSGLYSKGATIKPGCLFGTLEDALQAYTDGMRFAAGKEFVAAGMHFAFKTGASGIPAMPGVASAGKTVSDIDLYVSPSGTGNGMDVGTPCSLDDAENLTKELLRAHGSLNITVNLAAGTYTDASRWTFDNDGWAFGDGNIILQGPDAPDGVNTAIISSSTISGFLRCADPMRSEVRVRCLYLHFSGYTVKPVDLRLNTQVTMVGCSSDAPGGLVTCRNGVPEILAHPVGTAVATGGQKYRVVSVASSDWSSIGAGNPVSVGDIITATTPSSNISALGTVAPLTKISGFTDIPIIFQDCYGIVGDNKLSGGEPVALGFDFDGTAVAFQNSRGAASTYLVGNHVTAAEGLASISRNSRVRTQANTVAGPTGYCIERDRTCMWNNDDSYPDNFSGASAAVPVLKISVPDSQGGEQEGPLAIFQRKSRRDITSGPNLPNPEFEYSSGDVAEIKQYTNTRDWSAIATAVTGTITAVNLGNIVQFSADQEDIYNQAAGASSYGIAYKLLTSITSGNVVKVATAGSDYSGTGGPASSTKGEYYVATSSGSAPASSYVYASHRGTQIVADATDYFCLIAGDYSSVGGPASAAIGDKFTSTSAATLTGQLAVAPAEQKLHTPLDGGDLNWRLYRVAQWFWLAADTSYMRGRFNFEYAGGDTPDTFTLQHDVGTVNMWSVPLEKSGTGLDRFSVDWEIYGRGFVRENGLFSVRATEPAVESDGSSILKTIAGETDNFNSSMASTSNNFVAAELLCNHANLDAEIRLNSIITEGAY